MNKLTSSKTARWALFAVIVALAVGLIIQHPLLEKMALIALVAVTAMYAMSAQAQAEASRNMAEQMKLSREMQTMPSIIAYFDNPRSILIDLVIKNVGYGPAKDVSLRINPPLLDNRDRDINELSLFKSGINFFPPNREFRQLVGAAPQFFDKKSQRPLEYDLTVSYSDAVGNPTHPQTIPLDLSVYRDLPIARQSDVDRLTEEVKKITQELRNRKR